MKESESEEEADKENDYIEIVEEVNTALSKNIQWKI